MAKELFEPLETLAHEYPGHVRGFSKHPLGTQKAWRVNFPAKFAADGVKPEEDATVDAWIIQAAWAHPAWGDYWLHMIHLRPLSPGASPPVLHVADATHELWLYALNPDTDAETIARECEPFSHALTPINFAAQLVLPNDETARELAAHAARDVLDGLLNPDTDNIRAWATRFGSNMLKSEEANG